MFVYSNEGTEFSLWRESGQRAVGGREFTSASRKLVSNLNEQSNQVFLPLSAVWTN